MGIFFTSDTHFDDHYAIEYFNRPFRSVDEMNAIMVEKGAGLSFDVGVDCTEFMLLSLEQVTSKIAHLKG